MRPTVKYIAHYAPSDNQEQRHTFLAACTKLEYMFDCLRRNGCVLSVLSACGTIGTAAQKARVETLGKTDTLEFLPHGGKGHKFKNIVSELRFRRALQRRIDTFIEDGDTVFVYHSLSLIKPLLRAKAKKNFRLILEVEEIYGDVGRNARVCAQEYAFFRCADAYVFPTESLNRKVNAAGKPYAIAHGTYHAQPSYDTRRFQDGRIHCLYAGTLDPRKGGGWMAVEAAAHLPEGYHVHILGFGTRDEVDRVRERIAQIRASTACEVTYDGVLSGEAYTHFLQSCDIGLSTQDPDGSFNDTSFPSKVLSYMANGLRVVSVRIPVVEQSDVTALISYYDEQTPQAVADAIRRVNMAEHYDSRAVLRELDERFCAAIAVMLQDEQGVACHE